LSHIFLESIKEKGEQGRDKDFPALNFHAMTLYEREEVKLHTLF